MSIIILLLMLLMHIIEDFHIQGRMANMKQKSWWSDDIRRDLTLHFPTVGEPDLRRMYNKAVRMYGKDYVMVLFLHGFEWAMFIHLPIILGCMASDLPFTELFWCIIAMSVLVNALVHMLVDDLKCNRFALNLIADQLIHIIQVIMTYIFITLIL